MPKCLENIMQEMMSGSENHTLLHWTTAISRYADMTSENKF